MQKPFSISFRGETRWSCGTTGLVGYALWSIGEAATPSDIIRVLEADFNVTMRQELLGAYLQNLLRSKRVVKLVRGIYIHADHAAIFT